MKGLVAGVLVLLLIGCDHHGRYDNTTKPSLHDIDLTGKWTSVLETRTYKISTDEYLSSRFERFQYVFEETQNGVKYFHCWTYGGHDPYAVKTDDHLYLNTTENGFELLESGRLRQTSFYEDDRQPGFYFESIETLYRVDSTLNIDNGFLTLSGPISVNETEQVCLWQLDYSIGDMSAMEITVPFDDLYLAFRLDLVGNIVPGNYQYTSYSDNPVLSIDVISNATAFNNQVNSNILDPRDVTISVTESSALKFAGSFSFVGQDQANYSGEFEIIYP